MREGIAKAMLLHEGDVVTFPIKIARRRAARIVKEDFFAEVDGFVD